MNIESNPYQSPRKDDGDVESSPSIWRSILLFNVGVAGVLAMIVFTSFLWSAYETARIQQQLAGRRFASYDVEYQLNYYPLAAVVALVIIFLVANLCFFAIRYLQRLSQR